MQPQTIYLSFSALAFSLAHSENPPEDLDTALFAFGCARAVLFSDKLMQDNFQWFNPQEAQACVDAARMLIIPAVFRAETDRRIMWRDGVSYLMWSQLNQLLQENGFKPTNMRGPVDSLPDAEKVITAANPELRVRW